MSFISDDEKLISDEFLSNGYIIRDIANIEELDKIRSEIYYILNNKKPSSKEELKLFFDNTHNKIDQSMLNEKRVELIAKLNSLHWLRESYYKIGKEYLDLIVGNELSMQLRINLSIQFPNDDSSLLPLHCDTWSGDSPFEVVLWIPLVDCYDTKSMYLLSPEESKKLYESFDEYMALDSEVLYGKIKEKLKFITVKYGQLLIFNQGIPHGNRINETNDTRWSMNCRFKSIFSPYGDKKLGEFFEPINLKAASKIGMDYFHPKTEK
mgnify:CR=1 FL=1